MKINEEKDAAAPWMLSKGSAARLRRVAAARGMSAEEMLGEIVARRLERRHNRAMTRVWELLKAEEASASCERPAQLPSARRPPSDPLALACVR